MESNHIPSKNNSKEKKIIEMTTKKNCEQSIKKYERKIEDEYGSIKEVAAIIGTTASSFLVGGGASTIAIGTLTLLGITATAPLSIIGLAAYGITGIFTAKKLSKDIEKADLRNKVDEKFINEDYIVYDEETLLYDDGTKEVKRTNIKKCTRVIPK